jgi:2-polyprenyl-6-methoxyphenol hydroxylase-like FAD-dependent oxidoreductase
LLFEEAEKRGVQFRFGSPAETIQDNAERPVLTLKNGIRTEADLIIGADGTYYRMRSQYSTLSGLKYCPIEG